MGTMRPILRHGPTPARTEPAIIDHRYVPEAGSQ